MTIRIFLTRKMQSSSINKMRELPVRFHGYAPDSFVQEDISHPAVEDASLSIIIQSPERRINHGLHATVKRCGIGNIEKNRLGSGSTYDQDPERNLHKAAKSDGTGKSLQIMQRPVRLQHLRIQREGSSLRR